MARKDAVFFKARKYGSERAAAILDNLKTNHLWRRLLKNVVCTTTLVAICLIPAAQNAIGRAAYLGAITTVFGHPGRRFGQMAEALILAVSGTVLGVAWSALGQYLSSLVFKDLPPASYAIRGVFLAVAVLFHGYLRSRAPRLFTFVLLFLICCVVSLTSTAKGVTSTGATSILYPILIAAGIIVLVNVGLFPEFSSRFLGQTTIDTLEETAIALQEAGEYFVGFAEKIEPMNVEFPGSGEKVTVSSLTASKIKLRKQLAGCKAAQSECNFELAVSVLAPRDLKPISVRSMKKFVANTICVIGACESRFALLGEADDAVPRKLVVDGEKLRPSGEGSVSKSIKHRQDAPTNWTPKSLEHASAIDQEKAELEQIKPRREIEFGDARLLQYLLRRIRAPYQALHVNLDRTIRVIVACIAFAYDVPVLPSGVKAPSGIILEELDLYMDLLQRALARFDSDAASALEGASVMQELEGQEPDIMPREEVFLISSFILNIRQAGSHVEDMLKHSRYLVVRRQERKGRIRIYAPQIRWSNWLVTGGQEDEAMPASGRKANRNGQAEDQTENEPDAESLDSHKTLLASHSTSIQDQAPSIGRPLPIDNFDKVQGPKQSDGDSGRGTIMSNLRDRAADLIEWIQESEDLFYALKLTIAVFLVTWPAFVASWNTFYSLNRGLWAALQLVFITEVSVGSSINVFILRGIGTTLGCLWGWAALEADHGNRVVHAVMACIGFIPCAYVQLGSSYPKAGMVGIVSISVVVLATDLETVPGSATENFLKRWIAFMIGGVVAVIVEMVLAPVKARTRLVECLATSLYQINEMEKCIAYGIEEGKKIDVFAQANYERFERASGKANGALAAAETFLPLCSKEPRIKGSFEGLALIYSEVLFVLHQIVDKMENMLQLRVAYGSGPLEELNAEIYPYRRNVAGSITLTLFTIHGALVTKLALPQFLPSARLSHLRMINRVREVVLDKVKQREDSHETAAKLARQRAVRRKYMSWNAASAAQAEIIEFLEELIDLTKLLVGANEFRNGLLTRQAYLAYAYEGKQPEHEEERQSDGKTSQTRSKDDEEAAIESRDHFVDRPLEPIQSAESRGAGASASISLGNVQLGRQRRGTTMSSMSESEEVPASLRRIQSRKIEAGLRRQQTNENAEQQHVN